MPRYAANLSMLFTEHEFLDRFEAAAAAGFTAVEYLFPYDYPAEVIKAHLQSFNLQQVLFNLPAGDWAAGERGIACLPGREEEFRSGISQAIHYAQVLGSKTVNCLAGIPDAHTETGVLEQTLVSNLRFAADALGEAGIALVIEAINTRDMPGFYLNTTAQAIALRDKVASNNLFLQYDIYHMQIMEGNLAETLGNHLPVIGHIQLADTPGRHEPGTGEINYAFLLEHLDRIGYPGWVGCEYKPLSGTLKGLDWMTTLTQR